MDIQGWTLLFAIAATALTAVGILAIEVHHYRDRIDARVVNATDTGDYLRVVLKNYGGTPTTLSAILVVGGSALPMNSHRSLPPRREVDVTFSWQSIAMESPGGSPIALVAEDIDGRRSPPFTVSDAIRTRWPRLPPT